jgi:molybdenum cofactor cytidylyltransferase
VKPSPIAGIILAGGASRRMGTPKALLRFQGETFLDRLIRLFSAVGNPVIVVVGHHAEAIRSGIERSREAVFVVNPDPERGMLSSLQCGLEAVPPQAEAVLFTPVDHPNLESSTLEKLKADFLAKHAPVTVPTHGGKHGHPVCIARPVIAELLSLPPEAQASDVIHRYVSGTSYIEVPDSAILTDVDDQAAYAELISHEAPRSRPL